LKIENDIQLIIYRWIDFLLFIFKNLRIYINIKESIHLIFIYLSLVFILF